MESIVVTSTDQDASDASAAAVAVVASSLLPPIRRAAVLLSTDEGKRLYWDRSHYDSPAAQTKALKKSSTLYVGNLSFEVRSRHIRAHFSQIGPVGPIHLGLDRLRKTPCGFCFVEYINQSDALAAVAHLSGTKLDGNVIRVELDAGFQPGRQYGRGVSGGQVRDDRRKSATTSGGKRGREQFQSAPAHSGAAAAAPSLSAALSTPRSAQTTQTGASRGEGGDDDTAAKGNDEAGRDGGNDDDGGAERQAKRQRTF